MDKELIDKLNDFLNNTEIVLDEETSNVLKRIRNYYNKNVYYGKYRNKYKSIQKNYYMNNRENKILYCREYYFNNKERINKRITDRNRMKRKMLEEQKQKQLLEEQEQKQLLEEELIKDMNDKLVIDKKPETKKIECIF